MRRFVWLAALVVTIATPASAEILAVCGNLNTASTRAPAAILSSAPGLPDAAAPKDRAQIALLRDDQGFDLLLNWGEQSQHSLRAEGADILGNEMGGNFVHLVVARTGGHSLEHFLFNLNEQGFGELVWSMSRDGNGQDGGIMTAESVCVRPR
jgi:hypothetical protein